ncbi:acyl-CoA/acyl-ACP dehydrogenase [Robbsia sp. Bb-Pol-6]|uniref:Acyl-CoA/acyl-ACP dehydrogenase n=1 Tax=Robbsia betulipollinis TaxID=2981849 RepID=A0ABT3ZS87_9BURK|nr:acyl-CoA dehydrogenase family protein [Robbsia betulipollinis]MCY0389419.1 acyl-CoA/acyl-ACP dehydrogenase [Robbsia betulipollinis]
MIIARPTASRLESVENPRATSACRMPGRDWNAAAKTAAGVAAEFADAVDVEGRFPAEGIAALREQRLLAAAISSDLGGDGATLRDIATICRTLGTACASTAMIYAMHQAQVYCLIKHMQDDAWFATFFQDMARAQWLLASATSEDTVGGDLRSSVCAVVADAAGDFTLSKRASTISYGAQSDAILVTARRTPDAAASDQVLVMLRREDLSLQPVSGWNTLGMRGTCSGGFMLEGRGHVQQVFQTPFSEIASSTILPVSHVLWASVWLGIATDAVRRGQKYFRKQARSGSSAVTQSGLRLANALGLLRTMEASVHSALLFYEDQQGANAEALSFGAALRMDDLKIRMSNMALEIVGEVMQLCGMAAYKNDTPFSLGRHLRDLHSAPIMINNDRLAASMAVLMMAERAI